MHAETSPAGHPTFRALWDRLILSGSSSRDDQQQDVLVAALNRLGDRELVDWALRGLESDQTWTRTASAWVLGEHGFDHEHPWRTEAARLSPWRYMPSKTTRPERPWCAA